MKTNSLYFTCLTVLLLCCSMSKCKNDELQPETTVHGVVKDFNTGLPISGYKLIVENIPGGSQDYSYTHRSYDTIYTKVDGSYQYTFTPVGDNEHYINPVKNADYSFYNKEYRSLTFGRDNTFDFVLQKLINLNLHLVNNTAHSTTYGECMVTACCYYPNATYADLRIGTKKLDTVIVTKIARRSDITVACSYYNFYNTTVPPLGQSTQSFKTGLNDTTVTVINP